mgnify:FL=1
MKVGIVSDHRGYELKKELVKELTNYELIDYGTYSTESVDYPDYAFLLGDKVVKKEVDYGIAICGSGIGISIACNKVNGIRCAKVNTVLDAKMTRLDNDANVIALSAKTNKNDAIELINTFLETKFSNEKRHINRINKIKNYEENR